VKELKTAVKASAPLLTDEQRRMIYDNLTGAARVPLRDAFKAFAAEHGLELSDLWPAFEHKVSLVNIRNKLVHGDFETDRQFGSLIVAASHLRWTLERMALAVFVWPVVESEVAPQFLAAGASAMVNRNAAMADLGEKSRD
jgi:hypothetical protein